MKHLQNIFPIALIFFIFSCTEKVSKVEKEAISQRQADTVQTAIGELVLPAPYSSKATTNTSKVIGWPEGKTPTAPEGFTVRRFAGDLENPRSTIVGPNGDIFVAESNTRNSADRITVFQDKDKDGNYETREVFKEKLNQPYGMLIIGDYFYIADTDGHTGSLIEQVRPS